MTLIGKLLAVLNLLIGLALVTWATSLYAQRPGWFDPAPESYDKGSQPVNFAMVKGEVESLAKSADAASGVWGANLKVLEAAEGRRDKRRAEYAKRTEWAKTGNPGKGGAGFFEPVMEKDAGGKDTSFIDVDSLGKAIKGADDQPLRGADTLLKNFSDDVKTVSKLAMEIEKARRDYADLSKDIILEEGRLLAMLTVRDSVLAEAFYLATFEVNVYETRETVLRRKRQLIQRLTELGGVPKK